MKTPHPRVSGSLSIVRLSRTDWRISSASDPDELLGYVERQRGGRFEVMWMTDPMRWGYAASFEEALSAFSDSARFTGSILDRRAPLVARKRTNRLIPTYFG